MIIQSLYLDFIDNEGKTRSISVDEPVEDLTEVQVKTAMENIITLDIFEEYRLVGLKGARIVTKTIEDLEVQ